MRLRYDSKRPRRIEVVVYGDDVIDVPDRIGEELVRVTGFVVDVVEPTEPKRRAKPSRGDDDDG